MGGPNYTNAPAEEQEQVVTTTETTTENTIEETSSETQNEGE